MRTIIYRGADTSDFICESISLLLKESFEERRLQGINFGCGSYNAQDVKKCLRRGGVIICIYDNENLIGTCTLIERAKGCFRYVGHENLAIANSYKGKGIASQIFNEVLNLAKDNHWDFISSCTATAAISSIKYHLKVGFVVTGKSYGKDYDSYSFIYPLKKLRFLRIRFFSRCVYYISTVLRYIRKKI